MLTNRNMTTSALLACLMAVGGCASYYQVKDPGTGRTYYAKDIKQRTSGAVMLKDGKSGEEITVQNSEVRKVDKEYYEKNLANSGRDLEGEARAAAEAKAAQEKAAAEAKAAEEQRQALARANEDARAAEARAKEAEAKAAEAQAGAKKPETDAALAGAAVGTAAAKHAESIQQLRADLVASKDQVDRTLASLTGLADPNQADPTAAYKQFNMQLDRMNQHSQKVKAEADGMRQAREDYFAKWDARLAATENPTIRAEAESKRARLRAAQEKIATDAAKAREAYQPFIIDLEDTRKFVGSDVSKESVSVLAPTVKKAQQDGAALKQKIDVVIADLDAVDGKPTTRPAPAAQPAAATEAPNSDSTAKPAAPGGDSSATPAAGTSQDNSTNGKTTTP
jgi:hypothetical protein